VPTRRTRKSSSISGLLGIGSCVRLWHVAGAGTDTPPWPRISLGTVMWLSRIMDGLGLRGEEAKNGGGMFNIGCRIGMGTHYGRIYMAREGWGVGGTRIIDWLAHLNTQSDLILTCSGSPVEE